MSATTAEPATTEPTVVPATLDALEALLAAHRHLAELEDDVVQARLEIEECEQALKRCIEEQVEEYMEVTPWKDLR